jgi:hypothetical protein
MRRHPTHGIRGAKPRLRKVITESDDEVEQLNHQYAIRGARQVGIQGFEREDAFVWQPFMR